MNKQSRVALQTESTEDDFYLTIDGVPIPGAQSVSIGQTIDDEMQEVTIVLAVKKAEFTVEDTEEAEVDELDADTDEEEEDEEDADCADCQSTDCPLSPAYVAAAEPAAPQQEAVPSEQDEMLESLLGTVATQQDYILRLEAALKVLGVEIVT